MQFAYHRKTLKKPVFSSPASVAKYTFRFGRELNVKIQMYLIQFMFNLTLSAFSDTACLTGLPSGMEFYFRYWTEQPALLTVVNRGQGVYYDTRRQKTSANKEVDRGGKLQCLYGFTYFYKYTENSRIKYKTRKSALKSTYRKFVTPKKVLIWADLRTDRKSKNMVDPKKNSTHIFCSGINKFTYIHLQKYIF
jgi:hypothetical protein